MDILPNPEIQIEALNPISPETYIPHLPKEMPRCKIRPPAKKPADNRGGDGALYRKRPLIFGGPRKAEFLRPTGLSLLGGPFDLVSRVSKVGYGGL